jgi:hypothetical protein
MGDNRIVFWEVQRMVSQPITNAADGATVVVGNVFNSASSHFIADGVVPGDILTITGGADAGTYVIATVPLDTRLTVVGAWPVGGLVNQTFAVTTHTNFTGVAPAQNALGTILDPDTVQYGYVRYGNCARGGLFDFEANVDQWGTNPLTDWLRVMQFRLYLDLATPLTALTFDIISPEGFVAPIFLKGWDTFYNVGAATGSGDQDSYMIQHQPFVLRPGCSLRLITAGAGAGLVQAAEVWWERERVVVPNVHGDDHFFYNG